ncbi:hypothetical protein FPQ18DRAFT_315422 [Pyronema domesticum]|uniref:Uncharacterized protein n=1 Tax=Pyronema omphalodes (strain CBS 100304) TaxID=1076935 RepID=U4LAA1_PYROM|nr:hypothetical protein FPQ18DRAFT_315422 [Pyronema domesticum]CCX16317.1 Similar to hypothetical protein TRIVIDRAFT_219026 [Trichoderma virens Gv29-8]; acc. no. EHK25246 [Pyronema omphalodes CBS 100304]
MEFEWHTPRSTIFPSGITGIKRRAEYDLRQEQPLAKRLERLSLRPPTDVTNHTNVTNHINFTNAPNPANAVTSLHSQYEASATAPFSTPTSAQVATTPKKPRNRNPLAEQRMEVDNDNVVYIDSLDSDTDEEEAATRGKVIFIPDIEKKLNQIPDHILKPGGSDGNGQTGLGGRAASGSTGSNGLNGMDLVLYSVPKSLSMPNENCDGVRKAIIESRKRLREKNEREAREKAEKEALAAAQTQAALAAQAAQNGMMNTTNYIGMGHGMGNSFNAMPDMMNAGGFFGGFNNMTTANNGVADYDPDDMEIEL